GPVPAPTLHASPTRRSSDLDPDADLETRLGRGLDRTAIEQARRRRTQELLADREVLPGVLDLRERARAAGLKLGIASSSSRKWVDRKSTRLNSSHRTISYAV